MLIREEPSPSDDDLDRVRDAIGEYNVLTTEHLDYQRVQIFMRDDHGMLMGGILGFVWGGWMRIEHTWVDDSLRRHGWGKKLLAAAEAKARALRCDSILLETFSFQAKPFYERCGFRVVGELKDFPKGHDCYVMVKSLAG